MNRIAILGITGGGKSTLARRISVARGLPLHEMDEIGVLPGWKLAANEDVEERHERIVSGDRWVIDGGGSWTSIERRCDLADTLILIDQPAWRHHWWVYKRNLKRLFGRNPDLPEGCSRWPLLWKMMLRFAPEARLRELPRLRKLLAERRHVRQFVLRSPGEIEAFCREHLGGAAGG